MDFQTSKAQLEKAILIAERLTGKKESLPVLSCVVVEAEEKKVTLRATNLEAGVDISLPASVASKGTLAVPAGILRETVKTVPGDTIHLKEADGNLSVEARGSKNVLKTIPHEEFPGLPAATEKKGIPLPREKLLEAMEAVIYAASPSMIRPELGSVYLSVGEGVLVTVATDSFRLAEKTVKRLSEKEQGELLIPLRHAQELLHILERISDEDVVLIVEDTQLTVLGGSVRFISRVIDAQFPNYKEIIPKSFTTEATLLKSDFAEVLRKARVFSGTDQHVGFHIYPKRKIFTAIARSAEVGEMSDSIDAALSGDDIDINFHIGYLSDCLQSVPSDSITLSFAGAGRPLVIRGVSDASFMYLVMPLNR